jgi:hypothetical protein
MRASHTSGSGKAKCLNYRGGKRCGRVAKHEISFGSRHLVVCVSCLEALQSEHTVTVQQSSKKGFTVSSSLFGPATRTYKEIQ